MAITSDFATEVKRLATRLSSGSASRLPQEWIQQGVDDALLWAHKNETRLPQNEGDRRRVCASVAARIARQSEARFYDGRLHHHETPRADPPVAIVPLAHFDDLLPDAPGELPPALTAPGHEVDASLYDYQLALAGLPADLRAAMVELAADGPLPSDWLAESGKACGKSRKAVSSALARYRRSLRARLGLPENAGWPEIRRALARQGTL